MKKKDFDRIAAAGGRVSQELGYPPETVVFRPVVQASRVLAGFDAWRDGLYRALEVTSGRFAGCMLSFVSPDLERTKEEELPFTRVV